MQKITIPNYTRGEEWFSSITHMVGAVMSYVFLLLSFWQAMNPSGGAGGKRAIISAVVYGTSSIILYTNSAVYHGLYVNKGKKVMRVIDHCSVYLLICGTFTPYLLMCVWPENYVMAYIMLGVIWGLAVLGMILTAVNYEKLKVVLILSYVVIGWMFVIIMKPVAASLGGWHSSQIWGVWWILIGGIIYTIGALLYAVGKKKKWLHSIFHIFVDVASIAMFIGIFKYVLVR